MSLTIGATVEDLRVLIPFQAEFDATFTVTSTDDDPPDWDAVTFRLEVPAEELVFESEKVSEDGSSAVFQIAMTAEETDVAWRSRAARLELDLPEHDDPILIAAGVAEVVR